MLRLSPAHEAEREPACTRCLQQRRPKVSGELNVMSNGSARLVTGNKTSRCACAPKKCCKGLRLHSRQGELPRSSVLQTVNSRPSSRLPIATEIQSNSAGAACLETTTRDGAAADPSSRKAQPCSRFVSWAVMGPPDLSGKEVLLVQFYVRRWRRKRQLAARKIQTRWPATYRTPKQPSKH